MKTGDTLGQQVDQLLHEAHLPDALQVAQVLTNHSRQTIPLPDAALGLVLTKERLRKAAEPEQQVEMRRGGPWVVQSDH
jgi:hypothetical protein